MDARPENSRQDGPPVKQEATPYAAPHFGHSWKPALIAVLVAGLAVAAFIIGAWYHKQQFVCVMTASGTVVCGQSSGPAGGAAGASFVQPQAESYREGRRKVTETRCHNDEQGVQICRTTEYSE
ncbi:MAG: hypothetical protein LBR80_19000 [Deltaproteobacteria bacterium]|nr:hypothetical protein [Deltaproteobacteria bacterium]